MLLGPKASRDRYGAIRVELTGELMSLFESNKVDVIVLNEAPPLRAYEVRRSSSTSWPSCGTTLRNSVPFTFAIFSKGRPDYTHAQVH